MCISVKRAPHSQSDVEVTFICPKRSANTPKMCKSETIGLVRLLRGSLLAGPGCFRQPHKGVFFVFMALFGSTSEPKVLPKWPQSGFKVS